jgi:hypothetical protein
VWLNAFYGCIFLYDEIVKNKKNLIFWFAFMKLHKSCIFNNQVVFLIINERIKFLKFF